MRLPVELRHKIWGYVLGDQVVHLEVEQYDRHIYATYAEYKDRSCLHTICQAHVTDGEAYELSISEQYERDTSSKDMSEDMRAALNRHSSCYAEFVDANNKNSFPTNRLELGILRVW